MTRTLRGKWQATRTLWEFGVWFRNWREVWNCYRNRRVLPEFRIRGGPVLYHGPMDDVLLIFRELFVEHCYTQSNFYTPKSSDLVLDIGANIGIAACYFSWVAPGITVHSFEPVPATRERLHRNIEANGFRSTVTLHPEAVSSKDGTLDLFTGMTAGQSSLVASQFTGQDRITVRTISLESAIQRCGQNRDVDLLKVDVEGAEVEIFSAAPVEIFERVQRVAVEFHDLMRPGCLDSVESKLRLSGFEQIAIEYSTPDRGLGIITARRNKVNR